MSINQIPNAFGGFAPFPNTIATALLAYQSEAIGFGFGIKFQYSKRLIGAMTNDNFNDLDPIKIGEIVEAHNSELIERMKKEMPKWIQIQNAFIEATVEIEMAKANRTPSAFREIFEAFTSGFTEQQTDDFHNFINFFDDAGSKLLAFFGLGSSGSNDEPPPPPPDDDPTFDGDNPLYLTAPTQVFSFSVPDPIGGGAHTYVSPNYNLQGHQANHDFLMLNRNLVLDNDGQSWSDTWAVNVLKAYQTKFITFFELGGT